MLSSNAAYQRIPFILDSLRQAKEYARKAETQSNLESEISDFGIGKRKKARKGQVHIGSCKQIAVTALQTQAVVDSGAEAEYSSDSASELGKLNLRGYNDTVKKYLFA